jgi:prepilin peptidase CpaA
MIETGLAAALAMMVLVAAITDVRTRRIPNLLTATGGLVALILRAFMGGPAFFDGLLGAGVALALLLPLFAMGGVGGGDAKLLMVAGAFLGPKGFIVALLATALLGGLMSLAWATRRGVILPALLNTRALLQYTFTLGRSGERRTVSSPGALSVPYGVAIAAGSIFALWYGGV